MKVNMKVYSKSSHLLLDRRNRYEYIESHTGFGEPSAKFFDLEHDTVNVITDTGVLMGMNSNETKLITVFYPTLRQAERMARENGLFLTKKIIKAIVKNELTGLIAGQPEQKGKMKMKIEFEKPKQAIRFASLDVGVVFRDPPDDKIYMKTEYIDSDGDVINSIDLATGEFNCFSDDKKVYTANATLYIKEG